MKKIVIILAALVVILAVVGYYIVSSMAPVGEDTEEATTIEYGNKTYYEAEYQDGNSADKIGGLSYSVPKGFTPVNSDIDAVIENNFLNTDTGVQLSITQEKGKSASYCKKLSDEYLDGAEDVEKFQVGDYTCYKYVYKDNGEVIECDFHMTVGSSFYSGLMFNPEPVEDEISDEPDPIPLTEEQIAQFDGLCKSLSVK